ncbi:hypothetical protein MNBD_ALPHA08-421 [hydrothermal vent metagenome]|uniref:HTH marR-type domain-containing protein n=1 Tax=hydrothermal vent metagenome TaxID=652676 RepID=A0A3B0RQE0_9ZZZZ
MLADQIGHILRKASQRHGTIFSSAMLPDLTPTRFAAMVILYQKKSLSQNQLGRATAMDVATIKGVVDRMKARGLVSIDQDPDDARRNLIALTRQGQELIKKAIPIGVEISGQTLSPLSEPERDRLTALLNKII